jgi:DNA-binding HxlR family transcriptional regulator
MDVEQPPDVYSRDCPSRLVLDRIGDRWTALIVGVLEDGPHRFSEIRDAMGITGKVLTETLRTLERDGLVRRSAYDESPPRVEYELTPLGLTLREPLAAIRDWSEAHLADILAARERADARTDGRATTEASGST